jgi:protein-S-isoprenylcysteine O-methyltransferase Ste14
VNGRLSQAILAFAILPGVVGFVIPLLLIASRGPGPVVHVVGLVPLALGMVVLIWCVREFYVAGRGTLAPWAPPQRVVVTGMYRFSRNPMYVGVLLVLCGWAVGFGSWPSAVYTGAVALAFHLRVLLYEEPWLARTHGQEWTLYKARVPRWIGSHRSVPASRRSFSSP